MAKNFIKRVENFTCAHCGELVTGDGYTNHCPKCLWSQHVDEHPGDRAAECGGSMRPIEWRQQGGERDLLHRCERCGVEKWNKLARDDKIELLINNFYEFPMKQVAIYTTPSCSYCRMTKNLFAEKGVKYDEYDVASDVKRREEMIEKSGQMGVPVIAIVDPDGAEEEQIIIGFDKRALITTLGLK